MHKPGSIRDAIIEHLRSVGGEASTPEIHAAVEKKVGTVAQSSVRSYLGNNTPGMFTRIAHGRYKLNKAAK